MMSRISWPKSRFLPTPSARRATHRHRRDRLPGRISTHALREEGDALRWAFCLQFLSFLPTPSARRATHVDVRANKSR